jgi:hypothetical protein
MALGLNAICFSLMFVCFEATFWDLMLSNVCFCVVSINNYLDVVVFLISRAIVEPGSVRLSFASANLLQCS